MPATTVSFAQPDQPASVRYAEARSRSIHQRVDLPCTLASQKMSTVAAEVSGLVLEFPVREGDRVEKGQLLAKLRTESLELQIRSIDAQLEEDRTRRKLAEIKYGRTKELFEKNVLSEQELDDSRYELEALGKRIERYDADIARLQDQIDRAEVHAPFAGVVVAEHTQVGEWLEEGGAVVDLQSIQNVEVVVPVPERYIGDLDRRSKAQVRFESLPDLKIEAPVSGWVPKADPQARTFPVKIALAKPDRRLAVGMVCQASLALGTTTNATVIPKDALVREGPQEAVYTVGPDNRALRIVVRSGAAVGSWIEVQGAIEAGQKVIVRGNERLQPGQTLVPEAMEYPFP